jgi:hypothetical protein
MSLVAERKPNPGKKKPGRKPGRVGVPFHFYGPPELHAAMQRIASANRRTLTAELLLAIERHVEIHGGTPPPP